MVTFPYDDPIWKEATHAYGIGANVLLAKLDKEWNDDIYGLGTDWLDDYDQKTFQAANSIARPRSETSKISDMKSRLGPLDPITDALFKNYKSTVVCAHCGWTGEHP